MEPGFWTRFGKALVAIVGFVVLAVQVAVTGDSHVDLGEGLTIGTAAANGALVYLVPLFPGYRWVKNAIAGVLGVLGLGATIWSGGLDTQEIVQIVIVALTTAGVWIAPAVSDTGVGQGAGAPTRAR